MPSVGFMGSWCRSCATRSFINMFLSTAPGANGGGAGGAVLSDVNGGRRIAMRIDFLFLSFLRLVRVPAAVEAADRDVPGRSAAVRSPGLQWTDWRCALRPAGGRDRYRRPRANP